MRDYRTVAEAAAVLGLTAQRVRALCAAGRLRAVRFSGRWAIATADLVAFSKVQRHAGRPAKQQDSG